MLMTDVGYPDPTDDLAFLRSYEDATLRRIEVVSDALLERLFRAEAGQRALLAAKLLGELSEATQRLTAVYKALCDRSQPVARALLARLPNADEWLAFSEAVFEAHPEELIRAMVLDERAFESAAELAQLPHLARHAAVIRVHEGGPPTTLIEAGDSPVLHLIGRDRTGEPTELRLALTEARVTAFADATGQFVTIARDFLMTHIELREETLERTPTSDRGPRPSPLR
jgi:hypothetical protein